MLPAATSARVVPAHTDETLVVLTENASRTGTAWAERTTRALERLAPAAVQGQAVPRAIALVPAASGAHGRFWTFRDLTAAQREALSRDPAVAYAGPNRMIPIDPWVATGDAPLPVERAPGDTRFEFPDDLLYPNQQAIKAVRAPQAWDTATGRGILIAIVDTGVDLDHPDLADNIYVNPAEAAGEPGVDDDGNGYVDDLHGYDFTDAPSFPGAGDYLDRDPDPSDEDGHGTAVAGVAAAVWDNGVGIAGVAPEAKILPVRSGMRTSMPFVPALLQEDDAAAAVIYAADQGAHIINCSWGDFQDSPVIRAAVQYARERGSLVVASAGNRPQNREHYPSGYPGVLAVAATDFQGEPTSFSAWGHDLDLSAPGQLVLGPVLNGGWVTYSGTSISAPLTSGVLALVWSAHPDWSAEHVAWRVMDTAQRDAGWTLATGWGLPDAAAALVGAPRDNFAMELETPVAAEADPLNPAPDTWNITGHVLGASLVGWTLWAESEDGAERQVITPFESLPRSGVLGAWSHPGGDTDWILRLEADFGEITRERRLRLWPAPNLESESFTWDVQVGDNGWDLVTRWSTEERLQGAAALLSGDGTELLAFREEASVARGHALRFTDVGGESHRLGLWARPAGTSSYSLLTTLTGVTPPGTPPAVRSRTPELRLPAGSLLHVQSDVDGDGNPELVYEEEPTTVGEEYGVVRFVELTADLSALTGEAGSTALRGVPLDMAELTAPGVLDLLVFQLETWWVLRSPEPGAFPTEVAYSLDETVLPLGFVPELAGLLSVSGQSLNLHDAAGDIVWSAAAPANVLVRRGVWGDFDDDGLLEAFVVDRSDQLVVFRIGPDTGAWLATYETPTVGRELERAGDKLLITETTPAGLSDGGTEALGITLSQWRWSQGEGLVQEAERKLQGVDANSLVPADNGVWIRRVDRWDRFSLDGELDWEEALDLEPLSNAASQNTRGVRVTSSSATALWVGGIFTGESHLYPLSTEPPGLRGSAPRVVAWAPSAHPDSLDLTVAWSNTPCSASTLIRHGFGDELVILPVVDGFVVDTVPRDAHVVYTLEFTGSPCSGVVAVVQATGSAAPELSWSSPRSLSLRWSTAVPLEQPGRVEVRTAVGWTAPQAVNLGEDGRHWVLSISEALAPVDSVRVHGFRNTHGLPLGGAVTTVWPVPPAPEDATLFIQNVVHRPDLGELHVDFTGGEACETLSFLLSPGAVPLTGSFGDPVRIVLPGPLAAGVYRLEYTGDCPDVHPAGTQARFTVGVLAYPNPVGAERRLWISNLPPETRVELLDASGAQVADFRPGEPMPLSLEGIAPGLYVLRMHSPGQSARVTKIALR